MDRRLVLDGLGHEAGPEPLHVGPPGEGGAHEGVEFGHVATGDHS